MSKPVRIVVEIENGAITGITTDHEDSEVELIVVDRDVEQDGDGLADPIITRHIDIPFDEQFVEEMADQARIVA